MKGFKNTYIFLACTLFNVILALVILNVILFCYYSIRESQLKDLIKQYVKKSEGRNLSAVYENMYTVGEIYQIRNEIYRSLKYRYQPWVLFSERPFKGKYVNVSEKGYRLNSKDQDESEKKKLKIFTFGGSTMYGSGVPDDQTISAHLEREVPNSGVLNFGRTFYYDTQELQLFLTLLKEGNVPDIAIFLDGLNTVRILGRGEGDKPAHSDVFNAVYIKGYYLNQDLVPLLKFAYRIRDHLKDYFFRESRDTPHIDDAYIREKARKIIFTYRQNMELIKLIAAKYNVKVYFFWQPIPHYAYDIENHLFKEGEHLSGNYLYRLYNEVYSDIKADKPKDLVWLAEMFKDKKYVYVDDHHYNPSSCRDIAREIAAVIQRDTSLKE